MIMWPADRVAFDEFWKRSLDRLTIDAPVREHLRGVAEMAFLPAPLRMAADGLAHGGSGDPARAVGLRIPALSLGPAVPRTPRQAGRLTRPPGPHLAVSGACRHAPSSAGHPTASDCRRTASSSAYRRTSAHRRRPEAPPMWSPRRSGRGPTWPAARVGCAGDKRLRCWCRCRAGLRPQLIEHRGTRYRCWRRRCDRNRRRGLRLRHRRSHDRIRLLQGGACDLGGRCKRRHGDRHGIECCDRRRDGHTRLQARLCDGHRGTHRSLWLGSDGRCGLLGVGHGECHPCHGRRGGRRGGELLDHVRRRLPCPVGADHAEVVLRIGAAGVAVLKRPHERRAGVVQLHKLTDRGTSFC